MNKLETRTCEHCQQHTDRWTWRLIETYPAAIYEAMCAPCCAAQDVQFTANAAHDQAMILIGYAQYMLDGHRGAV